MVCAGPALADDAPVAAPPVAAPPSVPPGPPAAAGAPAAPEEPAATPGFHVGIDNYLGVSSMDGSRRFSDGFWAGSGAAYPSVVYARWENGSGSAAKVALGTGRMYTGSEITVDQPVEAWWQTPAGPTLSVTIGKYWIPFALQEWQYESKPGAMLQWEQGPYSIALSANYNENTHAANTYLRVGHRVGADGAVGLSLGSGKGLTYDTGHNRAWAADASFGANGWRLSGEYFEARTPSSQRFTFAYGKLAYENGGAWKPFVAAYSWKDAAGAFAPFDSTVFGLGYQVNPTLAIEGAYAPTSDRNVAWMQMHWTWER